MKLPTEQIQAILDGATHKSDMSWYRYSGGVWYLYSYILPHGKEGWIECVHSVELGDLHNLSDLRTILAQHKEIERLKAEQSEVAARAVEDAVSKYRMRMLDGPDIYSEGLLDYARQLREQ